MKIDYTQPRSYTWPCRTVLDQGPDGACVGFAVAHELAAVPVAVKGIDYTFAFGIYSEAKKVDWWPGENYEGTSVLAGIQVAQKMGYFSEYRWCFSVNDLAVGVSRTGPAVLGVNWYESMFYPRLDTPGRQWIYPAGGVVGGHAILCIGYNKPLDAFCILNSLGSSWANNGRAWIKSADMARLLSEEGEACIPSKRRLTPKPL